MHLRYIHRVAVRLLRRDHAESEALQNVAGTAANKSLDAVTCNVLNQTKLLWTAAFVVLRKQRQFTFREWAAWFA